jgi:sugar phosphate permease
MTNGQNAHDEKPNYIVATHVDYAEEPGKINDSTRAKDKKLLRRIDLRVLPWICLLYALSLIDRTNISAAKVAGMAKDLVLTGNRYNIALLSFFPTYVATEIPSNSIIRLLGTKRYLGFLILSWGTVAMCFGFVHSLGQLVALRVLLGLFEGGFNVSSSKRTACPICHTDNYT